MKTIRHAACLTLLLLNSAILTADDGPPRVIDIGSRRELFVDDFLIDKLLKQAERRLHHPQPREIVLDHDAPWEGSGSGYHKVFKDGDMYRMYYRGLQYDIAAGKFGEGHPPVACYAESRDGIHWEKPNLGLFEFNGSKENNIVWNDGFSAHAFAAFKDANPDAPADQRYKAISEIRDSDGLSAYASADGIRWRMLQKELVIPKQRADLSSLNLAFWDAPRGEYRAYHRDSRDGFRDVRTRTSKDFLHWSDAVWLDYGDAPKEHLYTNGVQPYYRAPHLLVGLPMRYVERGWSPSMKALPEPEHRELRAAVERRYGTAVTDTLLMTSRDGVHFHRWDEALLRPGPERSGTWNYGHLGTAAGLVETSAPIEGMPNELSLYALEGHWTGKSDQLRRYALRIDGFASIHAGAGGGELRTKPLIFDGSELTLNFATSARGHVLVAIHDADDKLIEGFGINDCAPIFGDTLDRTVSWQGSADLSKLKGRPVRLRVVLKEADLYSLQFRDRGRTENEKE